jgi:hypothetical protein
MDRVGSRGSFLHSGVLRVDIAKINLVMLSLEDINSSNSVLSHSLGVDVVVWDSIGSGKRNGVILVNSGLESIQLNWDVMVKLNCLSIRRSHDGVRSVQLDGVGVGEHNVFGAGGWEVDWFVEGMLDVLGGDVVETKSDLFSVGERDISSLCSFEGVNLVESVKLEGLVVGDVAV